MWRIRKADRSGKYFENNILRLTDLLQWVWRFDLLRYFFLGIHFGNKVGSSSNIKVYELGTGKFYYYKNPFKKQILQNSFSSFLDFNWKVLTTSNLLDFLILSNFPKNHCLHNWEILSKYFLLIVVTVEMLFTFDKSVLSFEAVITRALRSSPGGTNRGIILKYLIPLIWNLSWYCLYWQLNCETLKYEGLV